MAPPRRCPLRAPRALTCALLCAGLVSWSNARAHAQAEPPDAYTKTVAEAVREFSAGRWSEARALFKQAHALLPNARTLRGMGMAAYEMRLYAEAIDELGHALTDTRKPLTPEHREQVQGLIAAAKRFVGRYQLTLSPPAAELKVDGKLARFASDGSLMLDAGPHELRADADGYQTASLRLRVEGGEDAALELALEPEQPAVAAAPAAAPAVAPTTQPASAPASPEAAAAATAAPAPAAESDDGSTLETFAWVGLVGAVAFGATSGIFWAVGEGQYTDIKNKCDTGCTTQEIDDSGVGTSDALTNVFLGLAVVSGAAGLVLFAIDATRSGEHDALALRANPGGVTVAGSF